MYQDIGRSLALSLPRTTEHLISDRIKFRVGSIVYCAFARDETTMGFGFPKVERPALVAAEPDKFFLPDEKNMRFQWVCTAAASSTVPSENFTPGRILSVQLMASVDVRDEAICPLMPLRFKKPRSFMVSCPRRARAQPLSLHLSPRLLA